MHCLRESVSPPMLKCACISCSPNDNCCTCDRCLADEATDTTELSSRHNNGRQKHSRGLDTAVGHGVIDSSKLSWRRFGTEMWGNNAVAQVVTMSVSTLSGSAFRQYRCPYVEKCPHVAIPMLDHPGFVTPHCRRQPVLLFARPRILWHGSCSKPRTPNLTEA